MNETVLDDETRAQELLQHYFESNLTEADAEELLTIWERGEALQSEAVDLVRLESILTFFGAVERKPIAVSSGDEMKTVDFSLESVPAFVPFADSFDFIKTWGTEKAENTITALPSSEKRQESGGPVPSGLSTRKPLEKKDWNRLRLIFVLVFPLIVWAVYTEFNPPKNRLDQYRFDPLVWVTERVDAEFAEGSDSVKKGQGLESEMIHLQSGMVELQYKNGIRVVLEGPVRYHVETEMRSACESGKISVTVPPEGKGFTVMTPNMTVRDQGTAFVLNVGPEKSDLHVLEGLVQAKWIGSKEWFDYPDGRGVSVNQSAPPKNIVADQSLFITQNCLADLARVFHARQKAEQQERLDRERNDPHLLLHLDWNTEEHRHGVRLAKGPLPGEQAALFQTGNDIIKAHVNGSVRQLTLTATVRLDGLRRACNTILATDGFLDHPGFCWSIDEQGRLQLKLLDRMDGTPAPYDSQVAILPKQLHTWVHVGVTIDMDRKELVHYLDGKRIATVPIRHDFTIPLNDLSVGNWLRSIRTPAGRQFEGRIGSIDVFARVLTPREIQERCLD